MGLPRSSYVREGEEEVYHCYSRCVRRAFLYGYDALTGKNFSHRKAWLLDRLKYLAATFAIEVCAYAIMMNHWHAILRTRPDIVASWSDREVATRWLKLFPRHGGAKGLSKRPSEQQICALTACPERIAELRRRLCSISWFMGRLNEFIARAANKEDGVKGRFWEGRFKCVVLLDGPAIVTGMLYADLNPIRAGIAATPEESDFTSIQERIRNWRRENMASAPMNGEYSESVQASSLPDEIVKQEPLIVPEDVPEGSPASFQDTPVHGSCADWLCPLQSDSHRRGILDMTTAEYFELVDRTGRILRADKRGAIDAELAPILRRIGANPEAWCDTVSHFGTKFRVAAGRVTSLRNFAEQTGKKWLTGLSMARASFCTS